jgi:formyl-CoA transferase
MAIGGATYITGYPDHPPVRPGPALADYMTATLGAFGAVLALYHRDAQRSGQGQVVDVALFETVFRFMEFTLGAYHKMGIIRERIGNGHPTAQPGENFLTSDGRWVAIACVGDRMFQRFARTVGREDWLADPRFQTSAGRMKDVDEIHAYTREWVGQRSFAEVMATMEAAEIPCAPVYSIADIAVDPHYEARGDILEVEDPRIGAVWMPAVTPRLSATPGAITAPAPDLGQHTREMLGGLLGLSDAELDALRAEGVI